VTSDKVIRAHKQREMRHPKILKKNILCRQAIWNAGYGNYGLPVVLFRALILVQRKSNLY